MNRRKAVGWLYSRHSREADFGWHHGSVVQRAKARVEWPPVIVAAILRGEDCSQILADHAYTQRIIRDDELIRAELVCQ